MDPLSVGGSVVGILAASGKIVVVLHGFIHSLKDAPKSALMALDEVRDITAALEQLQVYLIGAHRTLPERRSLISLESIVTILTGCVTTYSDLETILNKCSATTGMSALDRLKWVYYESEVATVTARLQSYKSSMIFMLTILQCKSMQEAEDSTQKLCGLVEKLLKSNADLNARIASLEYDHDLHRGETQAIGTQNENESGASKTNGTVASFLQDLENSRVYRRAGNRQSLYSISSSQRDSMAMSSFSELSLGNISIISVLALPVWSSDLSNSNHYRFGKGALEITAEELGIEIDFDRIGIENAHATHSRDSNLKAEHYDHQPNDRSNTIEHRAQALPNSTIRRKSLPTHNSLLLQAVKHINPMEARSTVFSSIEPNTNNARDGIQTESSRQKQLENKPVLFIGASLFEFNTESTRHEGGFPYLTYAAGEIFDVVGSKGQLWLARNQDDPTRRIGWIWEKHFAKILPDNGNEPLSTNEE